MLSYYFFTQVKSIVDKVKSKDLSHWADMKNQRKYFNWLGQKLGYTNFSDYYKLSALDIRHYGGRVIISNFYNDSHIEALMAVYPEFSWVPWGFSTVRKKFWEDPKNHRLYFDWLARHLNIQNFEDWYAVSTEEVVKNGGNTLLDRYDDSAVKALITIYPEHPWKIWLFETVYRGFWDNKSNHRLFFDWLGQKLGYKVFEDWYSISYIDIRKYGGGSLVNIWYDNSTVKAILGTYPEFSWKVWRFTRTPAIFWDDNTVTKEFVVTIEKELSITEPHEWYRVGKKQILQIQATKFVSSKGGLFNLLKEIYPYYPWDIKRFNVRQKKSSQWELLNIVKSILSPNTHIIEEYIHPTLHFSKSGRQMTFDIFVPSLSLAFEFHGLQHFGDSHIFGPTDVYRRNDEERRQACKRLGITLIEVPHWWSGEKEDITTILRKLRPDISIRDDSALLQT